MQTASNDPIRACEAMLAHRIEFNSSSRAFPGITRTAERLLSRSDELREVYCEVYSKLNPYPPALEAFLDTLLSVATYWNPEKIQDERNNRRRLDELNKEISNQAANLAELLAQRAEICNMSAFTSHTIYHPVDLIHAASADNMAYIDNISKQLECLAERCDLKYWPTLDECMSALSKDADVATIEASHPIAEAAARTQRASQADFVRALLKALSMNRSGSLGKVFKDFWLSDASLASVTNCALDLGPDQLVGADYVKGIRQRDRN